MLAATDPGAITRGLAATLARIEAVRDKLSAPDLVARPDGGGWSANEILWHIRATADFHGKHIRRILEEDSPTWRHVSPRSEMKKARYDALPFAESLAGFRAQRIALVERLAALEPAAWQRFAIVRVPWMKENWRLTLHERVAGMVEHEHIHCAEMEQIVER